MESEAKRMDRGTGVGTVSYFELGPVYHVLVTDDGGLQLLLFRFNYAHPDSRFSPPFGRTGFVF